LLWGPSSTFVGHPYSLDKLPYDPKELVPVARVTNTVVTIAVPASLNVGSMKELIALAREQPGKLNWASVTTVTDIVIAGYARSAGLDIVKISYKDTVSALNDLIEGRIHFYGAAYAIVRTQAQAGRIKLLAVTNRTRVPGLDLPTVAEAGFPELNFDGLVGLMAARSSGISDAARERIAADVKAVAADPLVADRLTATAQLINPGTGAEFAASIDEQATQLRATAKVLGMQPKF
jgi:tripartite-type tricarboxylate transporter receptor subunit TctC